VERNFDAPGLVKDFDFARQPLYARMQRLAPVQKSPNAALWSQLLSTAQGYGRYLKTDGYNRAQVRQGWRDYVKDTLEPWVAEHPAFKVELAQYGRTLLDRLLS
jgi:hypothetical protein